MKKYKFREKEEIKKDEENFLSDKELDSLCEEKVELKESRINSSDIEGLVNPWGSRDVDAAAKSATNFKLDMREIEDYFDEVLGGIDNAKNIDPVGMIYQIALDETRGDVENYLDIELDDYGVYVAENYLATGWDYSDGSFKEDIELAIQENPKALRKLSKTTLAVLKDMDVNI